MEWPVVTCRSGGCPQVCSLNRPPFLLQSKPRSQCQVLSIEATGSSGPSTWARTGVGGGRLLALSFPAEALLLHGGRKRGPGPGDGGRPAPPVQQAHTPCLSSGCSELGRKKGGGEQITISAITQVGPVSSSVTALPQITRETGSWFFEMKMKQVGEGPGTGGPRRTKLQVCPPPPRAFPPCFRLSTQHCAPGPEARPSRALDRWQKAPSGLAGHRPAGPQAVSVTLILPTPPAQAPAPRAPAGPAVLRAADWVGSPREGPGEEAGLGARTLSYPDLEPAGLQQPCP